ncbi:carboxymuconolactone decarboxylase family protein [Tenacibaculum caenipelagi]|uniref:AhpD family alkylhydroperoxidase n=1 Tax=Tenacibaculum caenipelagi TaxID=1325435 RepID=A0A4V3D2T7_9FLAO|nr:carboxymuconolactone decarboxylase family protein [Tenacibaculum caenipelagi]TDQ22895.1 AhpD family alkylhydroperoxidase [Tenacibaculum caenipelagi]
MERITYQDIPSGMFENLMTIENSLNNSTIDLKLLELIRLRASQKNGCSYCVDMHHKELKHLGETELRLSSICVWESTPYFSEKERAVLALTETLTYIDVSPISNEMHHTLATLFSKEEICYITLAISQINTWNRLMKVFEFTPGNHKVSQ